MMSRMDDMTREEITDWISAINQLNENTVTDGTATFEAHEAVQRLWSGFGWTGAPHEVILMLIKAVETGYGLAVQDLQSGRLDHLLD